MNPRVASVRPLDNYQLELEFDNGESGIFSVEPYLKYPVFRPLEDEAMFRKAKIVFGTVAWNSDIDMSSDNLYLDCKMFAKQ